MIFDMNKFYESTLKINNCCRCEGKQTVIEIDKCYGHGEYYKIYQVKCQCGLMTIDCSSKNEAIKIWNSPLKVNE